MTPLTSLRMHAARSLILGLSLALFAAGLVVMPEIAQAALELPTAPESLPTVFATDKPGPVIALLWNIAIAAAAIVFMVLLLIGGLQYLTSAGADDTTKKAKQLLLDAVIGLVIVLLAWPVGIFALRIAGLAGSDGKSPLHIEEQSSTQPTKTTKRTTGTEAESGSVSERVDVPVQSSLAPGTVLVAESKTTGIPKGGLGSTTPEIAATNLTFTESLDNQGRATFQGVDPKGTLRIWRGADKAELLFEGYAPVKPGSTTATLLQLDSTTKPTELVTVRVALIDRVTTKAVSGASVGIVLQSGSDYTTAWINTAGYADVKLRPGTTYQVSLSGATISEKQDPTLEVPKEPKGTTNPTKVLTLFVTPDASLLTPGPNES